MGFDRTNLSQRQAGLGVLNSALNRKHLTGITAYLEHPDAKLEEAQKMAGHVDLKTTRLYDRRRQTVSLDEVERIEI